MTDDAAQDLDAWLDELTQELGRHVCDTEVWNTLGAPDDLAPVDFEAELRNARQASDEALLVGLIAARRMAWQFAVRHIVGYDLLLMPRDAPMWRLVDLVAAHATRRAMSADLIVRWVNTVPGTLRDIQAVSAHARLSRALESAAPDESMADICARVGVSRATGYRLLARFGSDVPKGRR